MGGCLSSFQPLVEIRIPIQVRPVGELAEIRIPMQVRPVGDVVGLPEVGCSWVVVVAVRRMIAQWLHVFCGALVDHDLRIHGAGCCCYSRVLEGVIACVRTAGAPQDVSTWCIWRVRWPLAAHDFWDA